MLVVPDSCYLYAEPANAVSFVACCWALWYLCRGHGQLAADLSSKQLSALFAVLAARCAAWAWNDVIVVGNSGVMSQNRSTFHGCMVTLGIGLDIVAALLNAHIALGFAMACCGFCGMFKHFGAQMFICCFVGFASGACINWIPSHHSHSCLYWSIAMLSLCFFAICFYIVGIAATAHAPPLVMRRAKLYGFLFVMNFCLTLGLGAMIMLCMTKSCTRLALSCALHYLDGAANVCVYISRRPWGRPGAVSRSCGDGHTSLPADTSMLEQHIVSQFFDFGIFSWEEAERRATAAAVAEGREVRRSSSRDSQELIEEALRTHKATP